MFGVSNQQISFYYGRKYVGDLKQWHVYVEVCVKKLASHLRPKFIFVITILSQTQTGSKKYDTSVIELSQNQPLRYLGGCSTHTIPN